MGGTSIVCISRMRKYSKTAFLAHSLTRHPCPVPPMAASVTTAAPASDPEAATGSATRRRPASKAATASSTASRYNACPQSVGSAKAASILCFKSSISSLNALCPHRRRTYRPPGGTTHGPAIYKTALTAASAASKSGRSVFSFTYST